MQRTLYKDLHNLYVAQYVLIWNLKTGLGGNMAVLTVKPF